MKKYVLVQGTGLSTGIYYIVNNILVNPYFSRDEDTHYYGLVKYPCKYSKKLLVPSPTYSRSVSWLFFKQSCVVDEDNDFETIVKRNCTYFI